MKDPNARPISGAESSTPRPTPPTLKAYLAANPKVSQRRLAQRAECNQSMISMIAKGQRDAGGKLAERLHAITGVPIKALLHATKTVRVQKSKRGPPAVIRHAHSTA